MNRINAQGLNLIEYKKELNKNYSDLVQNALLLALTKLVEEKRLDEETLQKVQDQSIDMQTFSRYLLSRKEYTKNTKELLAEFEKVRYEINAYLIKIGFVDNVSTESIIDKNIISVIKTYNLPQDFILNYFGIKENQLDQLMKKKGFIEKFAVLRMTKVCKEICLESPQDRYITQAQSLVYFNKKTQSFSIDYRYNLNVDYIAQTQNTSRTLDKIKETDSIVETLFLSKMGIDQYEIEPNLNTSLQHEKQTNESDSYRKKKELTIIDQTPKTIEEKEEAYKLDIPISNHINEKTKSIEDNVIAAGLELSDNIVFENDNFEDDLDPDVEEGISNESMDEYKEFLDPLDDVEVNDSEDLTVDDETYNEVILNTDINYIEPSIEEDFEVMTPPLISEPEPEPEKVVQKAQPKPKKNKNGVIITNL